jgi:hypothetical protein
MADQYSFSKVNMTQTIKVKTKGSQFAIKSINNVNGLNYNINNVKEYFNSLNECVLMILNFALK